MAQGGFRQSYEQYLILRGYDPTAGAAVVLKRALLDSWGEPGFHQFWRIWNPGIGHLLYRLYLMLGGNRMRLIGTMLVFTLCGLAHDALVMLIFRRPFAAFTVAFALSGVFTVISRCLQPVLHQERWPRLVNVLANVSCLGVSIHSAVQLQMLVFP